jgi:hypothetical protein
MKKFSLLFFLIYSAVFAKGLFDYPPHPQPPESNFILAEGVHYIIGMSPDRVIELENECQFKTKDGKFIPTIFVSFFAIGRWKHRLLLGKMMKLFGYISRWFSSEPYILVSYRATRHNLYVRAAQMPL